MPLPCLALPAYSIAEVFVIYKQYTDLYPVPSFAPSCKPKLFFQINEKPFDAHGGHQTRLPRNNPGHYRNCIRQTKKIIMRRPPSIRLPFKLIMILFGYSFAAQAIAAARRRRADIRQHTAKFHFPVPLLPLY